MTTSPDIHSREASDDRLLQQLYDTILEPEQWQAVLAQIAQRLGGAQTALLSTYNRDSGDVTHFSLAGQALDGAAVESYNRRYRNEDVLMHRTLGAPAGEVLASNLHLKPSEYLDTAFYKEWVRSVEVKHAAMGVVHREEPWVTYLAVQKGLDQRDFSESDVRFLKQLIPHMRRAIQLRLRFQELESGQRALASLADRYPYGVAIVDRFAQRRYANPSFERKLADSGSAELIDGRLTFRHRRDSNHFYQRLAATLDDSAGDDSDASIIAVSREPGAPALHLQLLPLIQSLQPAALVLAYCADERLRVNSDSLQQLFALTRAEATLCAGLAAGDSLHNLASALNKSRETLRAQLKSVFGKLGVNSQGELISVILASPCALLAPPG